MKKTLLSIKLILCGFITTLAQTPTQQDCAGAIELCQLKYNYPYSLSGEGNIKNEINPDSSCLTTGEKNSVWFKFQIECTGCIGEVKTAFSIVPNNSSDNYDWAIYDLTNGSCADIKNKKSLEMGCNASASPGKTGPNYCGMGCCGFKDDNDEWRVRYLQKGGTYGIVVNHISGPNAGFILDMDTVCFIDLIHNMGWVKTGTTTPELLSIDTPITCGTTTLTFDFNTDIDCKTVDNADFTLTGPGGTYTLFGVNNSCSIGVRDTFTINVSPALNTGGTYTFALVSGSGLVKDLCGNAASAKNIQFNLSGSGGGNATILSSVTYCPNSPNDTLKVVSAGGTWSGTGIVNAALGIFSPSTAGVGTHIISYRISGTCSDSDTVSIVVTNAVNATINPAGPFCKGDNPVNLTAANSGGTWSGTGITNSSSGTFNSSVAGVGTHLISYAISGSCGNSDTINLIVIPDKDATITSSGPYCVFASPFDLTAKETGGTWSGTGITNTANGTFSPAVAGVGTHSITYILTGTCGNSSTKDIVVDSILDATIITSVPYCTNDTVVTLLATSPGGIWSGNGITNASNGTYEPSVAGQGTHTIVYAISGFCGDTDTVSIVVNVPPTITITQTDVKCKGDCNGQIITNVSGGGTNYTYLWNNGQTLPSVTGLCADKYRVTVTDNNGCQSIDSATVQDNNNLLADFSMTPLRITTSSPQVNFTNQSTGNIIAWNWTFFNTDGTVLDTSALENPVYVFPAHVGSYSVTLLVTDNNNCTDDTTQSILMDGEYIIYIPNVFTPNGDNTNDAFGPKGTGIHPDNYKLYIFDRWGELLFESSQLEQYWDGTFKGRIVQKGVYIWKIITEEETLSKEKHTYIGHVTVLK